MRFRAKPRRGHEYYSVVTSIRSADKVREKTVLYIGRLDNLTEQRRSDIVKGLKELNKPELISKFHSLLLSIGYKFPSLVSTLEIKEVYSYGQELALHKVCEEIDLINVVNRYGYKGGGPELGKVVEAMAIARNCDPCSYFQLHEWYSRSALPFFLKLPSSDLTYKVAIRALDYLQPENTVPMQVSLYENIRRVYSYECERLDIDITSTYFEGEECVLAEFGHPRGHASDKLQIIVAFVVDQKGVLVTHKVWPGNRTDAKSLKPVDRCLKNEFGLDAHRVVDRGMATWENLEYMDRKKERYLVALRAGVKGTGLLEEIKIAWEEWVNVGDKQVAASVIKGRRKYVVVRNSEVAETNKKERTKALAEANKYDGYQVFVTTEIDLSEKDVVESYRTRDQIEKAIRTLKSVLGLHPQYVRTKEHVLGNIFVCATAFQLRSILRMKIKDKGLDMSVEEAMKTLERLKAVHIVVGKDEGIQVHRKLTRIDGETRVLIEVFNMVEYEKFPEVDSEKFKWWKTHAIPQAFSTLKFIHPQKKNQVSKQAKSPT